MRHMLLGWNDPRTAALKPIGRQTIPGRRLLDGAKAAALPAVAIVGILAGVYGTSFLNPSSGKPQLAESSKAIRGANDRPEVHATFISHRSSVDH